MKSITTTSSAQISRVRFARPQANAIRLAATRGWTRGSAVPALAYTPMDVAYLRTAEPPG